VYAGGTTFEKHNHYNGSLLHFHRVERRQMGAYLCIASNDVPPAVSKRVTLAVNCKLDSLASHPPSSPPPPPLPFRPPLPGRPSACPPAGPGAIRLDSLIRPAASNSAEPKEQCTRNRRGSYREKEKKGGGKGRIGSRMGRGREWCSRKRRVGPRETKRALRA